MTNNANLSLFDNNADMTKALVAEADGENSLWKNFLHG